MIRRPARSTLVPYTTRLRSRLIGRPTDRLTGRLIGRPTGRPAGRLIGRPTSRLTGKLIWEPNTTDPQTPCNSVCRLLPGKPPRRPTGLRPHRPAHPEGDAAV